MFGIKGFEWIVILIIGLLLFGRRLPDVAKGMGRSIVEFRKGLKGIEDDIETDSSKPAKASSVTRPPLTAAGADARVSKADIVEEAPVEARPSTGGSAG
jgi:sec-independent protein translocase protein TatA